MRLCEQREPIALGHIGAPIPRGTPRAHWRPYDPAGRSTVTFDGSCVQSPERRVQDRLARAQEGEAGVSVNGAGERLPPFQIQDVMSFALVLRS